MKQFTPFTIQAMPAALLHPEYPEWDCYNIRDSRNVCRAQVGQVDRATEGMNLETAKLFAAAPIMLDALKYVVKYHRDHDSGEGELFGLDFVTTCIAAIAKAQP